MRVRRFTPAEFVDAALSAVEGGRASTLTLKDVGEAMGANLTTVYRYFPNKDALLSAMVDRVLTELVEQDSAELAPRDDLVRIALGIRRVMLDYPLLASTIVGSDVIAPSTIRLAQRVIANLAELGLTGDSLVRTYQTLENFVLGASMIDGDGSPNNWEVRRQRFLVLGDPAFVAAAASTEDVESHSEAAYLHGLSTLIEAAVTVGATARRT